MWAKRSYYLLKPIIPVRLQIWLRKYFVKRKLRQCSDIWPIDEKACKQPEGWEGWPENKKFALVLTHDVETFKGHEKCRNLMELEKELNFRSSFNFVPERYNVSSELRESLTSNGFEVGVHGLKHDGKLYNSRKIFKQRARRINRYLEEWGAVGFRSPAMHHNLEWIHDLNIEYDSSTFDTDPFEPQPDGAQTIFPFSVNHVPHKKPFIELPYTLPQDSTLFLFMGEKNIDIWAQKLDWLAKHGGIALVITHPDYMNFGGDNTCLMEYPVQIYDDFLRYVKAEYEGQYWHVLPKEITRFWKGFEGNGRNKGRFNLSPDLIPRGLPRVEHRLDGVDTPVAC